MLVASRYFVDVILKALRMVYRNRCCVPRVRHGIVTAADSIGNQLVAQFFRFDNNWSVHQQTMNVLCDSIPFLRK